MSKQPSTTDPLGVLDEEILGVLDEEILGRPAAAWMLLLYAGAIGVWFNVYHSVKAGGMPLDLAVGAGLTPTVITMLLSHLVAQERDRGFLRILAFAVLCSAMALSLRAVGEVVRPAEGFLWWLFGPVTDAAELAALYIVLKRTRERAAQRARIRAAQVALGLPADDAGSTARPGPAAPGDPGSGRQAPSAARRPATAKIDRSPEAESARRAYRKSAAVGTPLTDRALAKMFPPRSRTWAANRIAEVKASPRLVATGTDDGQP